MEMDAIEQIAALLGEAAEAHHQAYIETDGEDPEWPLWYADHLKEKLASVLGAKMTKSELVYLLVTADKEQNLVAPGANWPRYYANFFLDRYAV